MGLAGGTAALAALFFHQRVGAVDLNDRVESRTLLALVRTGELPDPLPEPSGQPVVAQVVDERGVVRASTPSASRVVPLLPVVELRAHDGGASFTAPAGAVGAGQFRVRVVRAVMNGTPVLVVTAVSFDDVRDTLRALVRVLVVGVPIVLLAAGIATWLAIGSALRPVDEMRQAADDVARTKASRPPVLPVPPSGDELARLAVTLNRMFERLSASAEQQRSFVADAAHELRSPIASIRAQLEVAMLTSAEAAQWSVVASDVLQDVERIERLADDMLFLARLDSSAGSRRETVDVAELLAVPPSAAPRSMRLEGDILALRRAIDNLFANARRHARERFSVTLLAEAEALAVVVDDDGSGIAPVDRERVFDRWVRLDEARARDAGGAGLGLAIARGVARAHGGDVTLDESPMGGVRARLALPRPPDDQADSAGTRSNQTWSRTLVFRRLGVGSDAPQGWSLASDTDAAPASDPSPS
jgi:signal transduction histidine kinase